MSAKKTIQQQRTPIVVAIRNNPGLPNSTIAELTNEGIGILDYGTEESLKAANDSGANRSFETLMTLSSSGGYGVIHTKQLNEVVIGRIPTPAIMFLELKDKNGKDRRFKGFQFDKFAPIDPDNFPKVRALIVNRTHLNTLNPVRPSSKTKPGNPGREAITDAYVKLELEGRLTQPN